MQMHPMLTEPLHRLPLTDLITTLSECVPGTFPVVQCLTLSSRTARRWTQEIDYTDWVVPCQPHGQDFKMKIQCFADCITWCKDTHLCCFLHNKLRVKLFGL